jgi:trk system potassium uptake protein TrkA
VKVLILGAGQVGYSIARYLAFDENDITVVDQDADVLKRISDKLDVQPVLGFASHPDILKQAGVEEADLIIAVTGSDEVNMIACEVAHSLFNVETKIARIRNQSYLKSAWSGLFHPQRLAIDVIISPETEVAKSLSRSTRIPGAFDVINLVQDRLKAIGVRCMASSTLINTPLRLLPTLLPNVDLAVICVNRKGAVFVPTQADILEAEDEVYLVTHSENIPEIMRAMGYHETEGRRIIIVGAGNIGKTLALEIEATQPDVKIKMIERNYERSELAARTLKNAEVLNGDALDYDVLTEANVQNCETVIAVTHDDKVNILASLLAKRSGAQRSLTLLNNMNYASLVTSLGVDAVINPRAITVSTILQHVRQGHLRSIHTLGDNYAEVIEAEARETNHIIGLSIEDITIKGTVMVAALVRGNDVHLMPERMIISVGDSLILVAKKEAIQKIERLFSIRPSYL